MAAAEAEGGDTTSDAMNQSRQGGGGQDQTEAAVRAGLATKCVAGAMPERAEVALEHGRKTP